MLVLAWWCTAGVMLVGARGFEPPTPASRTRRRTSLYINILIRTYRIVSIIHVPNCLITRSILHLVPCPISELWPHIQLSIPLSSTSIFWRTSCSIPS